MEGSGQSFDGCASALASACSAQGLSDKGSRSDALDENLRIFAKKPIASPRPDAQNAVMNERILQKLAPIVIGGVVYTVVFHDLTAEESDQPHTHLESEPQVAGSLQPSKPIATGAASGTVIQSYLPPVPLGLPPQPQVVPGVIGPTAGSIIQAQLPRNVPTHAPQPQIFAGYDANGVPIEPRFDTRRS